MLSCALLCLYLIIYAQSKTVFFSETFPSNSSLDEWVSSTYNGENQGEVSISAGEKPVDADDYGLYTTQDAKFYGVSRKIEPFSTRGKTFVLQYMVKYDQHMSCGGSYIKLLGSGLDQKQFHGESPYKLMFGPDICGSATKKVHVIFNYKDKNHLIKKEIPCKDDELSHLYTLIITPDNKYKVLIDNEMAQEGSLEEDWDMLLPKNIDDPEDKKPSDWVDVAEIDDPEDKKPEDWDQPKTIPDKDAKKPEDWDDEMDGEWERPTIQNPDYKGEWSPRKIPNPDYKGPWSPRKIKNPDFVSDPDLYVLDDVNFIGFDLWQVSAKTLFDNILLTDDPDFAKSEGARLWESRHNSERKREEEEKEKIVKEAESKDESTVDIPESFSQEETKETGDATEKAEESTEKTEDRDEL